MSSVEERTTADGVKRYRGVYRVDGVKKRTSWLSRKRDAAEEARRLEDAGRRAAYVDPQLGSISLDEAFQTYQRQKVRTPKVSSVASETRRYRTLIQPVFGQMPIKRITPEMVADWSANMVSTSGRVPADSSRSTVRRLLTAILDRAVDNGRLAHNPARTKSGKANIPQPRKQIDHRYLTMEQLLRLADCQSTEQSRAMVLIMGLMGLRWGEVSALTVGDFREAAARLEVKVSRSFMTINNQPPILSDTKTHENRTLKCPAIVRAAVEPFLRGRSDTSLVFASKDGKPLRHRSFTANSFEKGQLIAQSAVEELQALLSVANPSAVAVVARRGVFDEVTLSNVRAFQKRAGLPSTGVVDQGTWTALFDVQKATQAYVSLPQGEKVRATARARALTGCTLAAGNADWSRIRLHDLRHTAASLAISTKQGVKVVQKMLGHKDASVTLNTYAGLFEAEEDAAVDSMDALVEGSAARVWSPNGPHGESKEIGNRRLLESKAL